MGSIQSRSTLSGPKVVSSEPWASYSQRHYRAFTMSRDEVNRFLSRNGPLTAAELTGLRGPLGERYADEMARRLEEFGKDAFLKRRHLLRETFLAEMEGDEQQNTQ